MFWKLLLKCFENISEGNTFRVKRLTLTLDWGGMAEQFSLWQWVCPVEAGHITVGQEAESGKETGLGSGV